MKFYMKLFLAVSMLGSIAQVSAFLGAEGGGTENYNLENIIG